jgi:meckelin
LRFSCDLTTLVNQPLELYELYLLDKSKKKQDKDRLVPIPVRNRQYQDERGFFLNQNTNKQEEMDDFLSHRFFLFDLNTGIPTGEQKIKIYRFAETISLRIRTQTTKSNTIYPPVLTIQYRDTQLINGPVQLFFQISFVSGNNDSFWSVAIAFFACVCVLSFFIVLMSIFTMQRRNTRNGDINLTSWQNLFHFFAITTNTFALAFFGLLFGLTCYYLFFFKLQSRVYLFLPETFDEFGIKNDEYFLFRVLLVVAFLCQLYYLLYTIYTQASTILFFIDWEKARAKIVDIDTLKSKNAPVSIWRTILVANEWNELQIERQTSIRFTIVVMLFLLYGLDLRLIALPIPLAQVYAATNSTSLSASENNTINNSSSEKDFNLYLRFAMVSCLWLAICFGQRLWKWLIYERYFSEPKHLSFIDLCTVAKISVFLLDEMYHGYYLHCRSPYPFADGNMAEIVGQLKQEEAGLTVGRGLENAPNDCQCFEMFVTRKWKRKFQTLFQAAQGAANSAQTNRMLTRNGNGLNGTGRAGRQSAAFAGGNLNRLGKQMNTTTDRMLKHAKELSSFLKAFIENQEETFRWKLYTAQTCFSRFLRIPPEMTSSKHSLFVPGKCFIV